MDVEDHEASLLKKNCIENGSLDDYDTKVAVDLSNGKSTKIICNGNIVQENGMKNEIVKNSSENENCADDQEHNVEENEKQSILSEISEESMETSNNCEEKDLEDVASEVTEVEEDRNSTCDKSNTDSNNKEVEEMEEKSDVECDSKCIESEEERTCHGEEKSAESIDIEESAGKLGSKEVLVMNNNDFESLEKNDSEKENKEESNTVKEGDEKHMSLKDSCNSNDEVEIIGESKLVKVDTPTISDNSTQNVILMNNNFSPNSIAMNMTNPLASGVSMPTLSSGFMMNGPRVGSPNPISLLNGSHAPPKPKSSLDQIELIRWEIQNRLNTRPKYFKPNPSAELGPLAKFLFDIGSNMIKEAVYHELVKIQSKKNDDDALSVKEKEDLEKLKEIEKDLHSTIGHLKLKMKKRCKICSFHTESSNVMYHHKQFPHEDNKNLHCSHCSFVTKQPMNFKFHIEAEHSIQPRLHDKKSYFECDLCPYENNQEQKLNIHKQRCAKQFRPLFNLHPSCLSGAEINLCLENIFYKPVIPKNLKILQQKHAQQQAALAEARRQQAEVQALAAQKNAAAVAAKKQQQRQIVPSPRFNSPNTQFSSRTQSPAMSSVRYNSRTPNNAQRVTVANMLKDKQTRSSPHFTPAQNSNGPGGFEVCEICGGYVKDRKALRIHFFYAHRIDLPFNLFDRVQPPLYCATCYVRFWTAQGLRKHIDVHVQEKKVPDGFMGEGVHGKCISCGQLVGNIVVHMRVVHTREIHHYINALMCMFCGASFNSRPNVERHITDVHGTIDIATGAVKVKARLKQSPQAPKQTNNLKKSGGGKDNLVKGSVCVLCNLNFGRNVDLTRHCMRMHHTCMKCGMVVIDKASLLKHTCLSSPSGTRDCTMCSETGFHPAYYVKHLRDKHLRKFSITVARVSNPIIEKWIKRPYPFKKEDEFVEISDSDEDEPIEQVDTTPTKSPVVHSPKGLDSEGGPKKKARIGPASKIGRPRLSENRDEPVVKLLPTPPSGGKRKNSVESTPERMSKRRK